MRPQSDRQLFFLTVVARPARDSAEAGEFGGAYVNCWIDEASEEAAVSRAQAAVRDTGWILESIKDIAVVTRDTYDDQEEGRECFEQALVDGLLLVFHTFPNEPEEDEPIH